MVNVKLKFPVEPVLNERKTSFKPEVPSQDGAAPKVPPTPVGVANKVENVISFPGHNRTALIGNTPALSHSSLEGGIGQGASS